MKNRKQYIATTADNTRVVCSFRVLSMIFYLGCSYKGLKYQKGNCGVSIVRSGEAMEKALQVIGPQLDLYAVRNKTNI